MSTTFEKKHKECKHCGEEVLIQALRCKHCQGSLRASKSKKLLRNTKTALASITKSRKRIAISIVASIISIFSLYFGYIGISNAIYYYNTNYHVDKLKYHWHDGHKFQHDNIKFKLPEGSYYDAKNDAYLFYFDYPNQSKRAFTVAFRINDKNIESMHATSKMLFEYGASGEIHNEGFGDKKYKTFSIFHRSGHIRYYQMHGYQFTFELMISPFLGGDSGSFIVRDRILSSIEVERLR